MFYSASIIWCVSLTLFGREVGPELTLCFTCRGAVGPSRLFGMGKTYNPLLWGLLFGIVGPVLTWLLARRWPKSWVRLVNLPVALNGAMSMPPATGINVSSSYAISLDSTEADPPRIAVRVMVLLRLLLPCAVAVSHQTLSSSLTSHNPARSTEFLLRRRSFRLWSRFGYLLSAALDSGTVTSAVVIFLCLNLPHGGGVSECSPPLRSQRPPLTPSCITYQASIGERSLHSDPTSSAMRALRNR